jgi:glycosyltransferase involved in cell wall biosynthesis
MDPALHRQPGAKATAAKRAVIFNNYMHIRGGGERSTLVYALALKMLGYEAEIVSQNPIPGGADIQRYFGQEFADIETRRISARDIYAYLKGSGIDVFVNHTNGEVPRNPAPFGVYVQMFPVARISWWRSPWLYRNLRSYQLLVNISGFTKQYTDQRWDFPRKRSEILHPPISALFQQRRVALLSSHAARKKQILNIGRFSKDHRLHHKNQPLLLDAFMEARNRFPQLAGWSLIFVGPAMQDSAEYVRTFDSEIRECGAPVEVRHDLGSAELSQLMSESSMYVHTTGAFYTNDSDAFRCEHYGLSIVEAMSHGCIPLVYDRGGILEILKPAGLGFTYRTREELIDGMGKIAMLDADNSLAELRSRILQGVAHLNITDFTQAFGSLLEKHGLSELQHP